MPAGRGRRNRSRNHGADTARDRKHGDEENSEADVPHAKSGGLEQSLKPD